MSDVVTPPLVGQLEAILFASDAPLPIERIAEVLEIEPARRPRGSRRAPRWRATSPGAGSRWSRSAAAWRLVTRPEQRRCSDEPPAAPAQEPPVAGRGGDADDRGLPPADLAAGDRAAPRRRERQCADEPPRAPPRPDRGAQGDARTARPLRDDARVPGALRAPRPGGAPAVRASRRTRPERVRRRPRRAAADGAGRGPDAAHRARRRAGTRSGRSAGARPRPDGPCRPSGSTSSWPRPASPLAGPPSGSSSRGGCASTACPWSSSGPTPIPSGTGSRSTGARSRRRSRSATSSSTSRAGTSPRERIRAAGRACSTWCRSSGVRLHPVGRLDYRRRGAPPPHQRRGAHVPADASPPRRAARLPRPR